MSDKLTKKELNDVNGGSSSCLTAKCQAMRSVSLSYGVEFDAQPSGSMTTIMANIIAACTSYLKDPSVNPNIIKYFKYSIYNASTLVKTDLLDASTLNQSGGGTYQTY